MASIQDPYKDTVLAAVNLDRSAVDYHNTNKRDITQVFFPPSAYHNAVEEPIDLRRCITYNKKAAGMVFSDVNGRLIFTDIVKRSPAEQIACWRTYIRGAWLGKVGPHLLVVNSDQVETSFKALVQDGLPSCLLAFSHPEISHGLTADGIPQVNLDQINPRHMLEVKTAAAMYTS